MRLEECEKFRPAQEVHDYFAALPQVTAIEDWLHGQYGVVDQLAWALEQVYPAMVATQDRNDWLGVLAVLGGHIGVLRLPSDQSGVSGERK